MNLTSPEQPLDLVRKRVITAEILSGKSTIERTEREIKGVNQYRDYFRYLNESQAQTAPVSSFEREPALPALGGNHIPALSRLAKSMKSCD